MTHDGLASIPAGLTSSQVGLESLRIRRHTCGLAGSRLLRILRVWARLRTSDTGGQPRTTLNGHKAERGMVARS
eukprot:6179109-Pleurochrysis_carterae.AAC.3